MGHTPDTPEHDANLTSRDEALQNMVNALMEAHSALTLVRGRHHLPDHVRNGVSAIRKKIMDVADAAVWTVDNTGDA